MFVNTPEALTRLAEELRRHLAIDPRLAIDTEFIRERTYLPVLEIVQVAVAGGEVIAVLDIPALERAGVPADLGPLGDLLRDPGILKILHAGGQDMEILGGRLGGVPGPVFDTQVAAAFVGWGTQTGYGNLVQGLLGIRLSKEEGFADWSRRPLSDSMISYAENDVRYLHAVHDRLVQLLEKRGRTAWALEQTQRLLGGAADEVVPEDLWQRVTGRNVLDPKGLAILRELARWRDEEARRRDKPRRTVIKDEALVEIARRAPKSPTAVLALRGMPHSLGEKAAEAIVERVRRGLGVPDRERPRMESTPPLDDQGAALVELLSAVLRIRSMEEGLPPTLLATQDELRQLAGARRRPDFTGPLFSGWRGELIGDSFRDVLSGRSAVMWDAERDRLTLQDAGATEVQA